MAVPWTSIFRPESAKGVAALVEVADPNLSFYRTGVQMGALVAEAGASAMCEYLRKTKKKRTRQQEIMRRVEAQMQGISLSSDSDDSSRAEPPVPPPEVAELNLVDLNALLAFGALATGIRDEAVFMLALRGFLFNQKNVRILSTRSVFAGVARGLDRFSTNTLVQRCAMEFLADLFLTGIGLEAALRTFPAIFGRIRRARDNFGSGVSTRIVELL